MSLNPPAVRVSPLIKFGRWSLLIAGVLYGAANQSRLSKKETAFREIEAKKKAERDIKLAAEKKIAQDRELSELAKMAGADKL